MDHMVPWFNNKSIFYANDWCQSKWVHKDCSPEPYTKGEGVSEMIREYFSPDFGYLQSHNGTECGCVIWKLGGNHDGYFDNNDFMAQVEKVMNILKRDYPSIKHLLIFDNATIHLKHPENTLSASWMPKFTPKEGLNWGIEVTKHNENGKINLYMMLMLS